MKWSAFENHSWREKEEQLSNKINNNKNKTTGNLTIIRITLLATKRFLFVSVTLSTFDCESTSPSSLSNAKLIVFFFPLARGSNETLKKIDVEAGVCMCFVCWCRYVMIWCLLNYTRFFCCCCFSFHSAIYTTQLTTTQIFLTITSTQ